MNWAQAASLRQRGENIKRLLKIKIRQEVIDDYNDLSNLGFEDKRESSSDGGKYRGYEH